MPDLESLRPSRDPLRHRIQARPEGMNTTFRAALLAACALATPAFAQSEQPIIDTTLSQIRSTPEAFKSIRVRFDAQYCAVGRIYNPFFTGFVPSDFANFVLWGAEQPIWRQDDFNDMYSLAFVAKRNEKTLQNMYELAVYDRIQVTAIVRNVFQGKPWMEIEKIRVLDDKVTTATLSHLFRGETLMQRREWRRAIAELSLAPADGTPEPVLAAVARNLGTCYLRVGEPQPAIDNLERALALESSDRETERLLTQVRRRPDVGLDRTVDTSRVRDHERPMWEAFEDDEIRATTPAR
jgi:tetratricopeptide (TPR) repeat protein